MLGSAHHRLAFGQTSYGLLYAAPRREQIYSALNRCVSWIQRTRFILFHPFSL